MTARINDNTMADLGDPASKTCKPATLVDYNYNSQVDFVQCLLESSSLQHYVVVLFETSSLFGTGLGSALPDLHSNKDVAAKFNHETLMKALKPAPVKNISKTAARKSIMYPYGCGVLKKGMSVLAFSIEDLTDKKAYLEAAIVYAGSEASEADRIFLMICGSQEVTADSWRYEYTNLCHDSVKDLVPEIRYFRRTNMLTQSEMEDGSMTYAKRVTTKFAMQPNDVDEGLFRAKYFGIIDSYIGETTDTSELDSEMETDPESDSHGKASSFQAIKEGTKRWNERKQKLTLTLTDGHVDLHGRTPYQSNSNGPAGPSSNMDQVTVSNGARVDPSKTTTPAGPSSNMDQVTVSNGARVDPSKTTTPAGPSSNMDQVTVSNGARVDPSKTTTPAGPSSNMLQVTVSNGARVDPSKTTTKTTANSSTDQLQTDAQRQDDRDIVVIRLKNFDKDAVVRAELSAKHKCKFRDLSDVELTDEEWLLKRTGLRAMRKDATARCKDFEERGKSRPITKKKRLQKQTGEKPKIADYTFLARNIDLTSHGHEYVAVGTRKMIYIPKEEYISIRDDLKLSNPRQMYKRVMWKTLFNTRNRAICLKAKKTGPARQGFIGHIVDTGIWDEVWDFVKSLSVLRLRLLGSTAERDKSPWNPLNIPDRVTLDEISRGEQTSFNQKLNSLESVFEELETFWNNEIDDNQHNAGVC